MAAGRYSFTVEQGTTLSFETQYTDSNGNPVDLTGYTGLIRPITNHKCPISLICNQWQWY